MSDATDTPEALATAVGGNAPSRAELRRRLEDPVDCLSLRMLGGPRGAENAAQDVLVKVTTNLSQFEGRSGLGPAGLLIRV